ncbi:MAG: zinc ribbon domain-containing protein [Puniceicoccales bacterium]|nr:zinc ribbon domain-containing protein [Puniceicoccales bacterium]
MPTYEYLCHSCGTKSEIFHSMLEPPRTLCPRCGKSALERQIGMGSGLLFRGTGFYETDYKKTPSQAKTDVPKPEKIETKKPSEGCPPKPKEGSGSAAG